MELQNTHEIINSHLEGSDLTDLEKYSLAIQIQRNQILQIGLGVDNDKLPYLDRIGNKLYDINTQFEFLNE